MRIATVLAGMLLMSVSTLSALDHKALAERIVQQMRLEPGEKVLLLSHPGEFGSLIPLLRQAVIRAGGVDLGTWQVLGTEHPDAKASRAALIPLLRNADLAVQRRFAAAMRAGEVRVTTPAGTDLRFRIGDRPVTLQDGDASAARAREARVLIDREIEIPYGAIRDLFTDATVTAGDKVWVRDGKLQ